MRTGHNGAIATTIIEAPVSISQVKSYIQSCYTTVNAPKWVCKADLEVCVLLPLVNPKAYHFIKCALFMDKSKLVCLWI